MLNNTTQNRIVNKINKNLKEPKRLFESYINTAQFIINNPIKNIKVKEIGKSYLGQSIYAFIFKLSRADREKIPELLLKEIKQNKITISDKFEWNKTDIKEKPEENYRRILIHGGIHAREGLSSAIILKLILNIYKGLYEERLKRLKIIEYFIYNKVIYKNSNYLRKKSLRHYLKGSIHTLTLNLIPIVNPDGVMLTTNRRLMWKKFKQNIRLFIFLHKYNNINNYVNNLKNKQKKRIFIPKKAYKRLFFINNIEFNYFKANLLLTDLNVNFPEKWGMGKSNVFRESPSSFVGRFPLSQSENISLVNETTSFDPDVTFSFHCLGNVIYYGYDGRFTRHPLTNIVSNILKFPAMKSTGSYGGYKEWFISAFNKPSFTIEFGCDVNNKDSFKRNYLRIFKELDACYYKVVLLLNRLFWFR